MKRFGTFLIWASISGQFALHAQKFPERLGSESTQAIPILKRVGFDQRLNAQIPLNLAFRDEQGRAVRLGDYFGRKPVVLSLAYYRCPMLCTLALNGQLRLYRATTFNVGDEFEVVTVSIDPRETPALAYAKKQAYVRSYGRPSGAAGWHFLTSDEGSIKALADAAGFHYYYDAPNDQYAHATGLMVVTPEGRISSYQYGVEYSARDLRLALIQASTNRIGTPVDQVLLYCFHYDPATGKYSAVVMNVLRLFAAVVLVILGAFLFFMFRRDLRRRSEAGALRGGR